MARIDVKAEHVRAYLAIQIEVEHDVTILSDKTSLRCGLIARIQIQRLPPGERIWLCVL